MTGTDAALRVQGLSVTIPAGRGGVRIVRGLDLALQPGELVALVGESGCGKSMSCLAIMGLEPPTADVAGQVLLDGQDLRRIPPAQLRELRGNRIAMIPQAALAAFNPLMSVGAQVAEAITVHRSEPDARQRAVELLATTAIPDAGAAARRYPHEFSGGMRQRAMTAMALANRPSVIVADEPTTALDATVQAQVLELLDRIRMETGAGILLVTHDLSLIRGRAERVIVMYAGSVVESGPADDVLAAPQHPYTAALLECAPKLVGGVSVMADAIAGQPPALSRLPGGCAFHPRCAHANQDTCRQVVPQLHAADGASRLVACHRASELTLLPAAGTDRPAEPAHVSPAPAGQPILAADRLVVHFERGFALPGRKTTVHAVCDVSLSVHAGQALGIVGESGSGKSTLARTLAGIVAPSAGTVRYNGTDIYLMSARERRRLRRDIQLVLQDPYSTLDPRMSVHDIVAAPLRAHGRYGRTGRDKVADTLTMVGIEASYLDRRPRQLSGGQRQRVGIARALVLEPNVLILDEPVSALDVSIQSSIVSLLRRLRRELGLTYIVIAHDLAVVAALADEVLVMHLGRAIEVGATRAVYARPQHPYTLALLSAVGGTSGRVVLSGEPPQPTNPPPGCRFQSRCWRAEDLCVRTDPELVHRGGDQLVACHFPVGGEAGGATQAGTLEQNTIGAES